MKQETKRKIEISNLHEFADSLILIDMQLGGSWVGAVDPKELPVEMWVDWVKYYEKR